MPKNMDISAYRLTVVAAIVVVLLSVAFVTVIGTPDQAKVYAGVVSTLALPGLFGLFKLEQNGKSLAVATDTVTTATAQLSQKTSELSQKSDTQHAENRAAIASLVADNVALKEGLQAVRKGEPLEQAAAVVVQGMQPDKAAP